MPWLAFAHIGSQEVYGLCAESADGVIPDCLETQAVCHEANLITCSDVI